MEENQKNDEEEFVTEQKTRCRCINAPWVKYLLTGVLIFAAAYCAFYTIIDWHMKLLFPVETGLFRPPVEKMILKDMKKMDKMFKEDLNLDKHSANIIHLQQSENQYTVIIDLRAFDNNVNNVQVTHDGNILTIQGRSIRKSKHNEQISEFQQSYMFGENVKLSDMTKEARGNYYIVTIPITTENDD